MNNERAAFEAWWETEPLGNIHCTTKRVVWAAWQAASATKVDGCAKSCHSGVAIHENKMPVMAGKMYTRIKDSPAYKQGYADAVTALTAPPTDAEIEAVAKSIAVELAKVYPEWADPNMTPFDKVVAKAAIETFMKGRL